MRRLSAPAPLKALWRRVAGVSREDVLWCYRNLLRREPESEEAILSHQKARDFKTLVRRVAASPEYALRNPDPARGAALKVLLLGGCQAVGLARLVQAMADAAATCVQLSPRAMEQIRGGEIDLGALAAAHDLVLVQAPFAEALALVRASPAARGKIRLVPGVQFSAFHPDLVYAREAGGRFALSPLGDYHSSIVLYGWARGLEPRRTLALFNEEVYAALGFFDYWEASRTTLLGLGEEAGLPLEGLLERWNAHGCWMHSTNHPKLFVLADIARALLEREGVAVREGAWESVYDGLADGPLWPVYPEIGRRLGIPGHYRFQKSFEWKKRAAPVLGLEEFVHGSYEFLAAHRPGELACERLDSERYRRLEDFLKPRPAAAPAAAGGPAGANPYQGLPDRQFWRRAVASLPPAEVDPAGPSRLALAPGAKVATAGSCFAQHLARVLPGSGFKYYVAEDAPGLPAEEARRRNYGVFSARYGNLYTAAQLLQLFDRAYGAFDPAEPAWARPDGRLADPFRPQIEPDGYPDAAALEADRAVHLAAVRRLFETLDAFVFTLGLTEAWRSRADGAVFPLAPGVAAGRFDPAAHEFVNFGVAEVAGQLRAFIDRLRGVNPAARVILTVSPVPLIATYEDRHVLEATAHSKAVLRAAAAEALRGDPLSEYFPAYEIITGAFNRGGYFGADLREVAPAGVEHVMRAFAARHGAGGRSLTEELLRENAGLGKVACDEEVIDAG